MRGPLQKADMILQIVYSLSVLTVNSDLKVALSSFWLFVGICFLCDAEFQWLAFLSYCIIEVEIKHYSI